MAKELKKGYESKIYDQIIQHRDVKLFVNYIIIGGVVNLFCLALLYFLTEFLQLWYLYSAALAYFVGMTAIYLLNKYLNFKDRNKKIVSQVGLFVTASLIGLGFYQIILYCLVEFAGLWYMFAAVISLFILVFWNFYSQKLIFQAFK